MNGKIETYIGFAIKKGSVVYGCDNIGNYRKRIYLILYTESLSANSLSALEKSAHLRGCPLRRIDEYAILTKKNCKALAICDKSLSSAILDNLA